MVSASVHRPAFGACGAQRRVSGVLRKDMAIDTPESLGPPRPAEATFPPGGSQGQWVLLYSWSRTLS